MFAGHFDDSHVTKRLNRTQPSGHCSDAFSVNMTECRQASPLSDSRQNEKHPQVDSKHKSDLHGGKISKILKNNEEIINFEIIN